MTTITQFVDRLDDYASNLEPRRALIATVALPLWLVGFIIGIIFRALWLIVAYLWSAAAVGFEFALARGRRE